MTLHQKHLVMALQQKHLVLTLQQTSGRDTAELQIPDQKKPAKKLGCRA